MNILHVRMHRSVYFVCVLCVFVCVYVSVFETKSQCVLLQPGSKLTYVV